MKRFLKRKENGQQTHEDMRRARAAHTDNGIVLTQSSRCKQPMQTSSTFFSKEFNIKDQSPGQEIQSQLTVDILQVKSQGLTRGFELHIAMSMVPMCSASTLHPTPSKLTSSASFMTVTPNSFLTFKHTSSFPFQGLQMYSSNSHRKLVPQFYLSDLLLPSGSAEGPPPL